MAKEFITQELHLLHAIEFNRSFANKMNDESNRPKACS